MLKLFTASLTSLSIGWNQSQTSIPRLKGRDVSFSQAPGARFGWELEITVMTLIIPTYIWSQGRKPSPFQLLISFPHFKPPFGCYTATKEEGEPTFYQVSPTRPAAACPRHLYQPRVNQESCQSPLILGVIGMCLVDPSIRSWSWKLLGKTNGCTWIPLRRNKVLYWQQNESSKNKVNSISSPLSSVLGGKTNRDRDYF